MTRRLRAGWVCLAGTTFIAGMTAIANGQSATKPGSIVMEGRKLFLRDWKKDGKLNLSGDGLGPMFNDVSCVACHFQKGVGGGGPNEKNVDLLSLPNQRRPKSGRRGLIANARRTAHPAFSPSTTMVILHKHGPADDSQHLRDANYDAFRARVLGEKIVFRGKQTVKINSVSRKRPTRRLGNVVVRFSQRNTPALYGAGLIDSIPLSVLSELAQKQAREKRTTGVSGRVAGRFGWRGQTATLHDFVLGACANELGLEVPGTAQPESPDVLFGRFIPNQRTPKRKPDKTTFDLTDAQCRSLTAFVGSLPVPQRLPANSAAAIAGKTLFAKIGCADCHVPHVGAVQAIYSDLLLHDMGPGLADSVNRPVESETPSSGGYFGGRSPAPIAKAKTLPVEREWRTPPLWGVADSAPYLHDGRAATLDEAIRWHAGEAAPALRKYKRLSTNERAEVIAFLETLVAPGPDAPPVVATPVRDPGPGRCTTGAIMGFCGTSFFAGR